MLFLYQELLFTKGEDKWKKGKENKTKDTINTEFFSFEELAAKIAFNNLVKNEAALLLPLIKWIWEDS